MPLEIPGYYFDPARNKYFKIEKAQTAPSTAQWSSDSVKRRKTEDDAAAADAKRRQLLRAGIRKHEGLRGDLLLGGMLARECGAGRAGLGTVWGDDGGAEVRAEAWARGVVERGGVRFQPRGRSMANMSCLCVAGEGCGTDVGVAYGAMNDDVLGGTHLDADAYGRIGGREQEMRTMGRLGGITAPVPELVRCPQMSSVAYHQPSHQMLLTSRDPEENGGLFMFTPPTGMTIDDRNHWLIGQANSYQRIAIRPRSQPQTIINKCTPAPSSSPLLCIVGTNAGLLGVHPNGATTSLTTAPQLFPTNRRRHHHQHHHHHQHGGDGIGEIFDQAFSAGHPSITLVGGRRPRLWVADLRAPSADWTAIRTDSSVTHIRSLNEWQVLAAGLRSSMDLYDLRFVSSNLFSPSSTSISPTAAPYYPTPPTTTTVRTRPRKTTPGPNRFRPLLRFTGYSNAAHIHTGFDASTELGIAAAALDDGTVALLSLRTGSPLRTSRAESLDALGAVKTETPIRALQFQTLPGERIPSLFVAQGMEVRKFSFARGAMDE